MTKILTNYKTQNRKKNEWTRALQSIKLSPPFEHLKFSWSPYVHFSYISVVEFLFTMIVDQKFMKTDNIFFPKAYKNEHCENPYFINSSYL